MSLEPPSLLSHASLSSPPISRIASPSLSLPMMSATSPSGAVPVMGGLIPNLSGSFSASPSPTFDTSRPRSPIRAGSEPPNGDIESPNSNAQTPDVDPQILEALKSKDRLYVLKLGEQMECLINERRTRVDLTPSTSYQRLLVHRCSAYYKLAPESDPATKSISVLLTVESKIPARRLCELVPAEAIAQPAFKIMRRAAHDRSRSKPQSQAGSVAGEDADLSDIEPSESGSLGGRSNATGTSKKRMTIEEREAAYNEARSRIFMGFEEKEKEKEKDMSASSSTFSLVSGSASTSGGGGGSSVGDLDDAISSPATESEWSGPVTRDKKESRRTGSGGNNSSTSSHHSLRSNAPPFNTNGSSSSRGSRSSSPAIQYASLYEPPVPSAPYDPSQIPGQPPGTAYMTHYVYPYPPPGQAPPQAYAPYQYFAPYPYPSLQNPLPNSDPSSPAGGDPYSHSHQQPHQPVAYINPYVWTHAHQPPPPSQHPSTQPPQTAMHNSPPQNTPQQYQTPFVPAPYPPYPMQGYYPPPGQQLVPPPPPQHHMTGQPFSSEVPRIMNGNRNGNGNGNPNTVGPNFSRTNSRSNTTSSAGVINGSKRGAPPARTAWSYGPGVGMGGYVSAVGSNGMSGGEVMGPRLNTMRRTSGTSSGGSGSMGNRTPGDEASSTASSSTTSSSSRRTYTSTTSSQHPLPARPDWAVGLKPQPTLHPTHNRHHDNALSNSRNMSPARNNNQAQSNISSQQPQMPAAHLQSTDFPPLTTLSPTPEKRAPVAGGAWTNTSSTRSVFMPPPGHANSYGSALVHHPSSNVHGAVNSNNARLDEPDRGFERPPPKGNTELFNPKGVIRQNSNSGKNVQSVPDKAEKERLERERVRGEVVANAILADRFEAVSSEDQNGESEPSLSKATSASLTSPTT